MLNTHPEICNLCGGKVIFTSNAVIYGKEYGSGRCYLCTNCRAFVGTHEPRPTEALGILSDSKMRTAKKRCHALFDIHWKNQKQKRRCRSAMYRWLASQMDIAVPDCHFGNFTLEQLDEAHKHLLYVKDKEMRLDKNGNAVFSSRN